MGPRLVVRPTMYNPIVGPRLVVRPTIYNPIVGPRLVVAVIILVMALIISSVRKASKPSLY